MKLVSIERMRREDKAATTDYGIPPIVLMENAATETVRIMEEKTCLKNKKILVVCGGGNNGGDGFAIARKLFCKGYDVSVFTTHSRSRVTDTSLINYDSCVKLNVPFVDDIISADIIVDALLGIGIRGEIGVELLNIIRKINGMRATVFSVDVPSGICADTGKMSLVAVAATYTVAMGYGKPGLYTGKGKLFAGEVIVADICLPVNHDAKIELTDEAVIAPLAPLVFGDDHKGKNGTLVVAAGSKGMTGAAYLCCMGALRCSAGIVKLFIPENLNPIMEVKLTEAITCPVKSEDFFKEKDAQDILSCNCDAIVIGPGIGRNEETVRFVHNVIKNAKVPVVIDADGIYAVSMNIDILQEAKTSVILTPHPGEFSRLCGLTVEEIENDRIGSAKQFAKKHDVTLLLKGPGTVIAEPDGKIFINPNGNEGMAKGGSGDVLAGIIGAFSCRKALKPAVIGAFVHGKAGDKAAEALSKTSMLPTDILNYI